MPPRPPSPALSSARAPASPSALAPDATRSTSAERPPVDADWLAALEAGLSARAARANTRGEPNLVSLLSGAVEAAVAQGALRAGTRLPSVRQMATRLGVSTFTVAEAYAGLVSRQVLASRRGAGYFVQSSRVAAQRSPRELAISSQVSDDWLSLNMFAQGRDLLAAGCGWLPLSWYAENDFHAALRQATRIAGEHLASYGHPLGYAGLRQLLAHELGQRLGPVHADQLILTHGVTHGFELVMMGLLKPGDSVLVEEPGYWNLHAQLRCHGLVPIGVPRDGQGLDLDAMERLALAHRPRALFITTVGHNPLSTTIRLQQLHRVLALAERHDLWVIEDDIFRDLDGPHAPSLAGLDGLQRVLTLGGFSKTIAPAIRVGYVACPPALVQPLARVKMACGLTTSEINERAAARVLADPGHRRYLERIRHRLATSRERVVEALLDVGMAPLAVPDSGLYVCAGWPGGDQVDAGEQASLARQVAQEALAEGIALAPGDYFMLDQRPTRWFRFNVAHANDPRLLRFLQRVARRLPRA